MYLIVRLFYLYTPLNLLCKEMRCLNKIIIIIIIQINLIEQGQKRGWNAMTAEVTALSTTLGSVEDVKKNYQ